MKTKTLIANAVKDRFPISKVGAVKPGRLGGWQIVVTPWRIGNGNEEYRPFGDPVTYDISVNGNRVVFEKNEDHLWVDFGDVAHNLCGMQSQYCSRYVATSRASEGYPVLGEGLRWRQATRKHDGTRAVDPREYHFIQIHKDDALTFARRVNEYRVATHQIGLGPLA